MGRKEMKFFYLVLALPLVESNCAEKKANCSECRNWAAYMPGYFYTWTGPNHDGRTNNCKLYKKTGWTRTSLKGACSGESRGSSVWKDTLLTDNGGACKDCGPQGC